MPRTRNAERRFQFLDRCFSNFSKMYTFQKLREEIDALICVELGREEMISIRQLRNDIAEIRTLAKSKDSSIDVIAYRNGSEFYYRYSREGFSIYNNELSDSELQSLRSTIEMLSRYRRSNPWLEEVISNLEVKFGFRGNAENFVSFGQNECLKGIEYLSPIIDAVVRHRPLQFSYISARGKALYYTLHPYYIKQYNGRWFVFGWDDQNQRITNLALDRITSMSIKDDVEFRQNTNINFASYFDNIVGVTIPSGDDAIIETIRLRFTPNRFKYVTSKPIHPLQNIIERECIVELRVYPNKELKQQIFSFGPDVEVVSPEWLREEIRQDYEKCLNIYMHVQKECTVE